MLAALLTPGAAIADSVTGSGSFTDRFGWTYSVSVDANGGAFGEDARGTFRWISTDETGTVREQWEGEVTCLTVNGARATVAGRFTYALQPPHDSQGFWLSFEDNGAGARDGVSWLGFPLLADLPVACATLGATQLLGAGDVTVLDHAPTPAQATTYLDSVVASLDLPAGNIHTLRSALGDALIALDGPEPLEACGDLERFTRDVSNNPDSKLSADERARLSGYASRVRSAVSC
jgi:hypothetical protein